MSKTHKFSATHVEHHKDGSATVHHKHEEGPHKDVKHAVANLDGLHDSMQENLGQPNPGEAEANAGPVAVPGAVPGAAAPAPVTA